MHQDPDEFALLAAQAEVHRAARLAPGSAVSRAAQVVEIHGRPEERVLRAALDRVAAEADALRIRVADRDGTPRQRVAAASTVPLHLLDLRDHPDPLAAAGTWTRADLEGAGAPGGAPPATRALVRLADDRYWWYQRVDRIAVDAYGLHLLGRRTAEVHAALAAGAEPPRTRFAPLREVVEEEARYLAGRQYVADQEFWAARTVGSPLPVNLGGGAPTGNSATTLHDHLDLPPVTFDRLAVAAAAGRATWVELVVAATALHVHRATGARDLVLGLPLTNRRRPAALHTPISAENVLPLRLTVRPQDAGAELLHRVALEVRSVRRHQRYPRAHLRRDLGPTRAAGPLAGPVVDVKPFGADLDFGPFAGTVRTLAAGPVQDMTIGVSSAPAGGLRLSVDTRADRYDAAATARHRAGLAHLLDGYVELLLTDAQRPVGSLDPARGAVPSRAGSASSALAPPSPAPNRSPQPAA
ncbi:condensation domain-containing protein [Streptomyces sp. LE64]|uniref:condensation domain-containing protein n=1 Tax=Streptomyces sp. LE64 TaxID=3448653 RepID=UPI00404370F9